MGESTPELIVMKTLLLKYWVQLLFVIAASLLFVVLIPNEENSYMNTDVYEIRKKSSLILIFIILILLGIIFLASIKHLKNFKEFLNFTLGMLALGLLFFLVLRPIFLFAGFALNKLSAKESVEKKYRVIQTDSNSLELKNLQSGKVDLVEQIVQENEKYDINQDDTITLS
ncbi:MAG: hypothetical protein ACXWCZ_00730, partial [Flavisolibacter sp.]